MGVLLYMDVHVPGPITQQLRRRGVDVLTAQEDSHDTVADEQVAVGQTNCFLRMNHKLPSERLGGTAHTAPDRVPLPCRQCFF